MKPWYKYHMLRPSICFASKVLLFGVGVDALSLCRLCCINQYCRDFECLGSSTTVISLHPIHGVGWAVLLLYIYYRNQLLSSTLVEKILIGRFLIEHVVFRLTRSDVEKPKDATPFHQSVTEVLIVTTFLLTKFSVEMLPLK